MRHSDFGYMNMNECCNRSPRRPTQAMSNFSNRTTARSPVTKVLVKLIYDIRVQQSSHQNAIFTHLDFEEHFQLTHLHSIR